MVKLVSVLLNPAAGGERRQDLARTLVQLFETAGVTARIVTLARMADIPAAVRSAIESGADAVVAAGGDGTVGAVAANLLETTVPLAVLPLGTLNHFAKDARIPLDLEGAVRTIATGHVTRIDAAEVNGRPFVNNASIGVYPDMVIEREALRQKGYRKWTAAALASVHVLGRYPGVVVRVRVGEADQVFRTPFLFVGNNRYEIDGLRTGARTRLDSGQLFAYFAPSLHVRDLPKLAALALLGRARNNPALEAFAATALTVGTPGGRVLRVALDGEVMSLNTPLRFVSRPFALRVIVPRAESVVT